jgi:hypothetical protein
MDEPVKRRSVDLPWSLNTALSKQADSENRTVIDIIRDACRLYVYLKKHDPKALEAYLK